MLYIDCVLCEGNGSIYSEDKGYMDCTCERGYIKADDMMKVYVNVYRVTRHFGGHEEGGWYYNNYDCIECVPTKNKYSDEIKEELERENAHKAHGNIYSVLGGAEIHVMIEQTMKESETKERPYYE
jgi:hypothetical protein